jgi:hypothetical protein
MMPFFVVGVLPMLEMQVSATLVSFEQVRGDISVMCKTPGSQILSVVISTSISRFCGLVARVPGYRFRVPGSIPNATGFSE